MTKPQYDIEASGKKMKEIRISRGLSARQVMDYMGLTSVQSVYKWEAGKCYPQADNLLAIAKLYGVDPFDLLVEERK
ncbi:MAG TPA: helix-turn-helix transcriptional regulator [Lachnospiraceae bacterium]|nr:helix-turn-helix transcriptional regulator [Lachnospiraceae bacterium]